MQMYKKEMGNLKVKLNEDSGFDKIEELETKLKQSFNTSVTLKKEISSLNVLQNNQGKELKRISEYRKYEARISSLGTYLSKLKNKYKELIEQIEIVSNKNDKLKDQIQGLRLKYDKLLATRSNQPIILPSTNPRIEIFKDAKELKSQLVFLKATLEKERADNKNEIRFLLLEIYNIKKGIRELDNREIISKIRMQSMNRVYNPVTSLVNICEAPIRNRRQAFSTMRKRVINTIIPNDFTVN